MENPSGREQLVPRPAERRRLLEIGIGADDPDDIWRAAASLRVRDPNSALEVSVQVSPRITEAAAGQEPTNGPGRPGRPNGRAPAIERASRVQPRRLGHVVVGSLDQEASQRFFTEGLGPGPAGDERRDALRKAIELSNYQFNAHGIELRQRRELPAAIPPCGQR